MLHRFGFLPLVSFIVACSSSDGGTAVQPGELGGICDNGSCNAGLVCENDRCVSSGSGGSGGTTADGGSGNLGVRTGGTGNVAPTGGTGAVGMGGVSMGGTNANGGTGVAPPQGDEGGACYGNRTCNVGLTCASNLCVTLPGTGGTSGAGGTATGGSASGGAGGSTPCVDTSNDPNNCGQCGRVCRSGSADACVNGMCEPDFLGCITESDGFSNCQEYCANRGESCVQGACGAGNTFYGWLNEPSRLDRCAEKAGPDSFGGEDPCDLPLFAMASTGLVACCCTDTQ